MIGPSPAAAIVYIEPALASRVPNVENAQPTKSRLTSDSTYETQVPWPALANTSAGPKASDPLGPVPASDCAKTSRNGNDPLRRPSDCASAAAAVGPGDTDVDMRRSPSGQDPTARSARRQIPPDGVRSNVTSRNL